MSIDQSLTCAYQLLQVSHLLLPVTYNVVGWCSENTKTALLDSMYVFLKRPEFTKYTNELGSVSPRILLTGPPGMYLFATF